MFKSVFSPSNSGFIVKTCESVDVLLHILHRFTQKNDLVLGDLTSDGCYRCVTFQNGHVDVCADLWGITSCLGAAALCWLQVITAVSAGDWRRHRGHQAG